MATSFASLYRGQGAGPGWVRWSVSLLCSFLVIYHLYIGIYGAPTNVIYLSVHLGISMALLFLFQPLEHDWTRPLGWRCLVDFACIGVCFWTIGYFIVLMDDWQTRHVSLAPLDFVSALALILVVFEAVRRSVGWSLIVISLIFSAHALWAPYFPGMLNGAAVSPESLLQTLFVGDAGIFGVPVLVVAQYIVLFLLFGRLLQGAGAGAFFTRIAFALFAHRVGGPAKAAVVSSGLFGTISGSGVSNVLTTGAFTIPMMLRMGYRPNFAGGVEAAAAVGGAIMPPVMGAVAFMMAEFMGVPYVKIAVAAIIPALLYYFAIYWTVHFEARRLGLARVEREALPNPWSIVRRQGFLAMPLLTIMVMLALGYSIILVVVVTCLGTFLISFASRATRLTPSRIADALEGTGRTASSLTAVCACAGIFIGAIFATGLSYQLAQGVMALAGGNLWIVLVVSALIALVLGTGLTASAVYITMVATVIPILKLGGVPDMAAHMFAFYYGVVADITPPTALAAVAAAGIARANPMATMIESSRLGIAAFIVPFIFVLSPSLLMQGSAVDIVITAGTAALGLLSLSAGLAGFLGRPLGMVSRLALIVAAGAMIVPNTLSDLVGAALFAVVAIRNMRHGKVAPRSMAETSASPECTALTETLKGAEPAPPDCGAWGAWLVLAAAALALGWMGARSLHATAPLAWLAALAAVTVLVVVGLAFSLRRVAWTEPAKPLSAEMQQ